VTDTGFEEPRVRDERTATAEPLGRIIAVSGSTATMGVLPAGIDPEADPRATVSKFVMIHCGHAQLVGVVTEISLHLPQFAKELGYRAIAVMDLMGEIRSDETGEAGFWRGVSQYPAIGDLTTLLTSDEFRYIYKKSASMSGTIGKLQQDPSIEAYINVNELLTKHFAVLGTTGVGKSSAVVVILRQILEARPDLRIILLDAHNEYGKSFGDQASILNPRNLKLPFWLFNFEEIVDVFFGGRPGVDDEVAILAEVIPIAKAGYLRYKSATERSAVKRPLDASSVGFTVDTPVPYVLADMVGLIDERMGKLENRSTRMTYHKLISRIESVRNDPRYAFMFDNANVGGDTITEVLIQLFRLIPNGKPMTVMQLAGFPADVVDAVVSVLGRMAFEFGLWSDGASPLLFICEEAHRYAAADRKIGFGPTRRAISRIAKEGRKYGVFMGLVTQRPAELDPTILSQCSTLFVMRMSNDRDQEILRSAVSDAAAKLLDFVPSLGTRETFAFGEGVTLPTRLTFTMLPVNARPHNESIANWRLQKGAVDLDFITLVVERWRGNMASNKTRPEFQPSEVGLAEKLAPPKLPSSPAPAQPEKARAVPVSIRPAPTLARPLAPPERPAPTPGQPASATSATPSFASGIDPERYSILKKQILAGRDTATQPRNGTPTGPRKDTVPNP
jgi:DNA helicase HerA-like ATPase